jgi:hypothetical protein
MKRSHSPTGKDSSRKVLRIQGSSGQKKVLPGQLEKLFAPLTSTGKFSGEGLQTLFNKYSNFYALDPKDQLESYRVFIEELTKIPEAEQATFLLEKNYITGLQQRNPLSKELGRFTIDALGRSNLKGIALGEGLQTREQLAKGLFRPATQTISLNPSVRQDILSTIVHEGNHALEHYDPYVTSTLEKFLQEKIKKNEPMTERYIPQLYRGIQDIINLPQEFTKLYTATEPQQQKAINAQALIPRQLSGGQSLSPIHGLAQHFDEIPAFALESLMRDKHTWTHDEHTNPDSRKLLRRLMKDTHQLYSNKGLVDKTIPLPTFTSPVPGSPGKSVSLPNPPLLPYTYGGVPMIKYLSPIETTGLKTGQPKYDKLNEAFIRKIQFLKKRGSSQPSSSSSSSSSSSPYSSSSSPSRGSSSSSSSSYSPSLSSSSSSPSSSSSSSSSLTMPSSSALYSTQPMYSSLASSTSPSSSSSQLQPMYSSAFSNFPSPPRLPIAEGVNPSLFDPEMDVPYRRSILAHGGRVTRGKGKKYGLSHYLNSRND